MTSIGITGIIGSGKSMLSQVFRSMDIPVYDADRNAKLLMNKDVRIRKKLIEHFGEETYINGKLNKEHLSREIFGDEAKRKLVNSIVHPIVKDDFIEWRKKTGHNIVAIESAILFEAKIDDILDKVIFVTSQEETLIRRIMSRDHVDEATARKKIEIQRNISGIEKCDIIFINDEKHSLIEQANDFYNIIKQ